MTDKPVIPAPLFRAAEGGDADAFALFSCGGDPWAQEVENFIHEAALQCHLGNAPEGQYPHTAIVAQDDDNGIIAIGAVRRGPIVLVNGGRLNGIVLVFLAVATTYRGAVIEGNGRLSHALAREVIASEAQGRRTEEIVFGVIDFRNDRSLRFANELGFEKEDEFGAVGLYHDVHRTTLSALLERLDPLL